MKINKHVILNSFYSLLLTVKIMRVTNNNLSQQTVIIVSVIFYFIENEYL